MTNAVIVDIVRQQLTAGTPPTGPQTEALLTIIDSLEAELRAARQEQTPKRTESHPLQAQTLLKQLLNPAEIAATLREVEALHESELRYRTIADLISDYAYVVRIEPDGRAVLEWMTDAFTRITGYSLDEMQPRDWQTMVYPDDRSLVEHRVEMLLAGQRVDTEFRIVTKEGKIRWLHDTARPEWDESQGRVVRILGAAADVTERTRAKDRLHVLAHVSALLNASLNYEKTLDQVAHLAVPFLADGCFVDLLADERSSRRLIIAHQDPVKEQLLCELNERYPMSDEWPQPINDVVRTQKPSLIANISQALLQSVSRDTAQLMLLQQFNFTSAMIVPLLAHERMYGTMIFVSEQEGHQYTPDDLALAEELGSRAAMALDNVRLYAEAQAAVEARDEFLSIAAHELKTPTAALISATQLLRAWAAKDQSSSDRMKRELEVISFASQRLNKLIDSLTEFAQIQIGQFQLELQPVVLCAVARQVLSELQPTPRHYVALFCTDETLTVAGDAMRLERVLYNLVQNAIKYSPRGGPITVRIERQGDQALIRVTDQGIGIPEAACPQLFQRFYRASNAISQHIGGMGIGLYLVKEIVTRHGGSVEVNSIETYGSTFSIRLPLIEPERSDEQAQS